MKLKQYFERSLLCAGFALIAFFAGAKLHERVMSRAAIQRFEELKPAAVTDTVKRETGTPMVVPAVAPPPNFLSWSEQRIRKYEESLSEQVAPALAVIRIPRIGVEAPVLEGTDDITLNRGVGHIATTARFGETGNVGIAGHRDGFFRGLRNIKVGDRIDLEEPGRMETYIVDQLEIVNPANVNVLRSSGKPALTLVTCYPFYYIGTAPQRFIVHASLAPDPRTGANAIPDETQRQSSSNLQFSRIDWSQVSAINMFN
jgi:sortase A